MTLNIAEGVGDLQTFVNLGVVRNSSAIKTIERYMKFWTSGRIDIKISSEIFQPVMMEVDKDINGVIADVDFGNIIESYDVVVNIFENESSEKFWFSATNKETNIDVNIHHDKFLNGDFNSRKELYLRSILYSIDKIRDNKKLRGFNFNLFHNKVSSLLTELRQP